jgi:hypothetical protein
VLQSRGFNYAPEPKYLKAGVMHSASFSLNRFSLLLFLSLLTGFAAGTTAAPQQEAVTALTDTQRQRSVPVQLYFPAARKTCTSTQRCPVAIFSAGYGISYLDYSFIATSLTGLGYLVVSIQHELPADARLDYRGDIPKQLGVLWERGAKNIQFVRGALGRSYPGFDWQHPVLVGHSVGGDSSARLASEPGSTIAALITLDNRRAQLPRSPVTRVLSIRAADTQADPGVLPSAQEQRQFAACIVKIGGSRHNDMQDAGSAALKATIVEIVEMFLRPTASGETGYACAGERSLQ